MTLLVRSRSALMSAAAVIADARACERFGDVLGPALHGALLSLSWAGCAPCCDDRFLALLSGVGLLKEAISSAKKPMLGDAFDFGKKHAADGGGSWLS